MIVYHLRRSSEIPQLLADGLIRSDGRQYVFDRWQDAQLLLNALHRDEAAATDPHVALVLDVDEDMVARAPIPERKLPASLRPEDLVRLQSRSGYPEVDVNARRLLDVKNGLGDSLL